jgi:hypothetical protein
MSGALTHDPLRCVWDALERRGCNPHGATFKFRAACPSHDSDSPSVAVQVGADGAVVLWCHRGCDTGAVIAALGLVWADLFPAGHRHARPVRGVARAVPFPVLVLGALRELRIEYRCAEDDPGFWVAECCPVCRRADRWPLWIHAEDRGRVTLSCAGGCDQVDVLRALEGAGS